MDNLNYVLNKEIERIEKQVNNYWKPLLSQANKNTLNAPTFPNIIENIIKESEDFISKLRKQIKKATD